MAYDEGHHRPRLHYLTSLKKFIETRHPTGDNDKALDYLWCNILQHADKDWLKERVRTVISICELNLIDRVQVIRFNAILGSYGRKTRAWLGQHRYRLDTPLT